MTNFRRSILLFVFSSLAVPVFAQYFPQSGREALYQRALDARARLNVLSIALQPGYEDLATLVYFRLGRGARIVSAYVTNGEAGESDVRGEYPNQLAAVRRIEAAKALASLGGEEYFLNMPDFGAVRDTETVRALWNTDTLQQKIGKLLSDLRPDVILIARDWAAGETSPELEVLSSELIRAVRRLEPTAVEKKAGGVNELFRWTVDRVLLETGSKAGVRVPVDRIHPLWKKSYVTIGDEVGKAYESRFAQRIQWHRVGQTRPAIAYEFVYPRRAGPPKSVDGNLPPPAPGALMGIDAEVARVASLITEGRMSSASRSDAVKAVAAMIDSVDSRLAQPLGLSSQVRKICMQWKLSLESLRVALLGIIVRYSVDPSIVTERQVTVLKIDNLIGTKQGDSLWVYFPMIDQKWLVDEQVKKILPLRFDPGYRLVSPFQLERDLPAALDGLTQTSVGKSLTFFIMCKAKSRVNNFVFRCSVRMLYSPRFSAEVLTPIVRAVPLERVLVRLTNHSRDGVRDSVLVDDSLAFAAKQGFRLNIKDQSQVDTLILQWRRPLEEGTYLVPVNIATQTVNRFAARKFDVHVDTSKQVALITALSNSPTAETLRRLGVRWREIKDARSVAEQLGGSQVAILDRRALTLMGDLKSQVQTLKRYVENGGHLIVLAQDAQSWNTWPLVDGFQLASYNGWEEGNAVETDSTHRVLASPNRITAQDWSGWLFRRAHNLLSGPALASAAVPLKSQNNKSPFIAEWKFGSGILTYVDLALYPQFLNVQPGSFRLLANLVSY